MVITVHRRSGFKRKLKALSFAVAAAAGM